MFRIMKSEKILIADLLKMSSLFLQLIYFLETLKIRPVKLTTFTFLGTIQSFLGLQKLFLYNLREQKETKNLT